MQSAPTTQAHQRSRKLLLALTFSLLLSNCGPSMRELQAQALLGNKYAQFEYARRLMDESDESETKTQQEALALFKQCAAQGDANASLALGICYEYGRATPVNEERALHHYKKAGIGGQPRAYLYIIKLAEKRSNAALVTECLGKLAELRLPEYQIRYAIALTEGRGCEIDLSKAIDYWRYAAIAGSPEAMLMMGINYLEGNGVPRNDILAKSWCEMSANLDLDLADDMLKYIESLPKSEEEEKSCNASSPKLKLLTNSFNSNKNNIIYKKSLTPPPPCCILLLHPFELFERKQ